MVECLNCGKRREQPEHECPRCSYVGWAIGRGSERDAAQAVARSRSSANAAFASRANVACRDRHGATSDELWGGETQKAIANFPVSGEPIPTPVARWLGRIKAAAARVNGELGLLDAEKAQRIAAAADRIANGELDDQFPIDVFQTGSGTSSNMNANEVIATLAGEDVHANDDVNMGQSSNDVFPSAVHLAALDAARSHDLLPALDGLAAALEAQGGRSSPTSSSRAARTGWTRCR